MKIGRRTDRMSRPRKYTEEEKKARKYKKDVEYNKANTIRLPINLNTNTDKDIIDFLTTIPNKQGYIKDLIRLDMDSRKTQSSVAIGLESYVSPEAEDNPPSPIIEQDNYVNHMIDFLAFNATNATDPEEMIDMLNATR